MGQEDTNVKYVQTGEKCKEKKNEENSLEKGLLCVCDFWVGKEKMMDIFFF